MKNDTHIAETRHLLGIRGPAPFRGTYESRLGQQLAASSRVVPARNSANPRHPIGVEKIRDDSRGRVAPAGYAPIHATTSLADGDAHLQAVEQLVGSSAAGYAPNMGTRQSIDGEDYFAVSDESQTRTSEHGKGRSDVSGKYSDGGDMAALMGEEFAVTSGGRRHTSHARPMGELESAILS